MRTKQQLTRAIATALFTIILLAISPALFAQVKIGTNPTVIDPTKNLEVEASSGQKVMVNKIDGTVIIQNTPTSLTNTEVLTVDGTGLVSKTPANAGILPITFGTIGTGRSISPSQGYLGTGTSITLPANSTYIVTFGFTIGVSPTPTYGTALVRTTLSESNADGVGDSPDILGKKSVIGTVNVAAYYGVLNGALIVKNSTSSPKTYWLKGLLDSNQPTGGSYNIPAGFFISLFGGSIYTEGYFFGIPVNN